MEQEKLIHKVLLSMNVPSPMAVSIMKEMEREKYKKYKVLKFKKYMAAALVLLALSSSIYYAARSGILNLPWQTASSDISRYKNDEGLMNALKEYIIEKERVNTVGADNFVSFDLFGTERKGGTIEAYLWALIEEYVYNGGDPKPVSGSSLPMKIVLQLKDGSWAPVSYSTPGDGDSYGEDIKKLFPGKYGPLVMARQGNVKDLQEENKKAALEYFKSTEKTPDMSMTPELEEIYAEYAKSRNDEALRGLDPADIFKLYFHAKDIEDYETQYALYFYDEMWIMPTLQEFLDDSKKDPDFQKEAEHKFQKALMENLKSVRLVCGNGDYAYVEITFTDEAGQSWNPISFQSIKTKDGIWKVQWMPTQ
jgi:hypothetical protein